MTDTELMAVAKQAFLDHIKSPVHDLALRVSAGDSGGSHPDSWSVRITDTVRGNSKNVWLTEQQRSQPSLGRPMMVELGKHLAATINRTDGELMGGYEWAIDRSTEVAHGETDKTVDRPLRFMRRPKGSDRSWRGISDRDQKLVSLHMDAGVLDRHASSDADREMEKAAEKKRINDLALQFKEEQDRLEREEKKAAELKAKAEKKAQMQKAAYYEESDDFGMF